MTEPFFNTEGYFARFGYCGEQIATAPEPGLGLVVVIPCFNEPALLSSLDSLRACTVPSFPLEILVVVNSPRGASSDVLARNEKTLREAAAWAVRHDGTRWRLHLISAVDLPPKHAGVGLARKIGMDEALRRFQRAGQRDGIIVCFDADSTCDSNYLREVEHYFASHPRSPGCSIYFEHPLEGPDDPRVYEAIVHYELHLRYYVEGLRYAGFPHAFHTIGSSMAVRASAYLKQGGMNKRKAGEDFYFLHKIIPLGRFGELNTTRVIPSPRVSDRVPFGTGRAVGDYLASGTFETYPLQAFLDLRQLFAQAPSWYRDEPDIPSGPLRSFLLDTEANSALEEIRANTASPAAFTQRFFRWFDGFLAMKFIHFARDRYYGTQRIEDAAAKLLKLQNEAPETNPRALLTQYRSRQREKWAGGVIASLPLRS